MTTDKKIIFYSNRLSPFANRVWLALELSGLQYEFREVDLANKSEEFLKVSSTGKIPAISVDGENFVESAVIVDLIADLAPGTIRSSDPIADANSLLWADRYGEHVVRPVFHNTLQGNGGSDEDKEKTFFESLDKALPYLKVSGELKPVVGDVNIAPFILRIHLLIERGILPSSITKKLNTDKKYAGYAKYVADLQKLDASKATFNEDKVFARLQQRLNASLAAK